MAYESEATEAKAGRGRWIAAHSTGNAENESMARLEHEYGPSTAGTSHVFAPFSVWRASRGPSPYNCGVGDLHVSTTTSELPTVINALPVSVLVRWESKALCGPQLPLWLSVSSPVDFLSTACLLLRVGIDWYVLEVIEQDQCIFSRAGCGPGCLDIYGYSQVFVV